MSFFFPKSVTWDVIVRSSQSINKQSLATNGNSLTEWTRPQGTLSAVDWTYTPYLWNPFYIAGDLLQEINIYRVQYLLNVLQHNLYSTVNFRVFLALRYQHYQGTSHIKIDLTFHMWRF